MMSRQHASSSCAWMLGVVQAPSFFPRCLGRGANLHWLAAIVPTDRGLLGPSLSDRIGSIR